VTFDIFDAGDKFMSTGRAAAIGERFCLIKEKKYV